MGSLAKQACQSGHIIKIDNTFRMDNLIPAGSPLNYQQVVETTIDEFNDIMDNGVLMRNGTLKTFQEDEKIQFRDLRRKGKNRAAASRSRRAQQLHQHQQLHQQARAEGRASG